MSSPQSFYDIPNYRCDGCCPEQDESNAAYSHAIFCWPHCLCRAEILVESTLTNYTFYLCGFYLWGLITRKTWNALAERGT